MRIGIPKEIKTEEGRVSLTPYACHQLIDAGHEVFIEQSAGLLSGFSDDQYAQNGVTVLDSAAGLYATATLIVKVKEPQPDECRMLREGQALFTYLHLAPDPDQTRLLVESGVTAIAYETVEREDGDLPLLEPMSEVAGRLAPCRASPTGVRDSSSSAPAAIS